MTRTCRYPGCDIEISLLNASGYCGWHRPDVKRAQAVYPKCKHPFCGERVSPLSKSGYCRAHAHAKQQK